MRSFIPYARWPVVREAFLLGIARAYVLVDPKAHLHPQSVAAIWDNDLGDPCPPSLSQMRYVRAPQAAIARLREGNLGIEQRLGRWTGEFFHGLKLSGALVEKERERYRVDPKRYPELVADIHEWALAGSLGSPDRDGRCRLVGCMAARHLPAADPSGAGVIAGLFAGARLSEIGGETWLELPDAEPVRQLLTDWTILNYSSRRIQRRNYLKVSPFYAALVAELMSEHCRRRILSIRKPAMCPLLPILYWEWLFSTTKEGMPVLPFADALPFGISRRSFYRHGWRREGLHRQAVLEVGILSINARLREQLWRWFDRRELERNQPPKVSN